MQKKWTSFDIVCKYYDIQRLESEGYKKIE